jgi:tRNA-dihydrouridine synthase
MVTNKGQGSGLLPFPEKIEQILSESLPQLSCRISVKLRLGLHAPEEIVPVINVLNQFPIGEIILHPRIGKQLYKGKADPEIFSQTARLINHPLLYNGDILTPEDFFRLETRFEKNSGWMIGRGILQDPFLAKRIKTNLPILERVKILSEFHSIIFDEYSRLLSGKSHLLMRMLKFWSYFCYSFPDPHKTLKRIKKASTIEKYDSAVRENFSILNDHEEN